MGIGYVGARYMCLTKRDYDVNYEKTLTLARQDYNMNDTDLYKLYKEFGSSIIKRRTPSDKYVEKLLKAFGAANVDSIDASDFEGANIIHDLNKPVDVSMHNKYDCIIDIGTSEHVFNYPVLIKSVMDMLKIGGTFISIVPANQFNGHGFYQFSAALFIELFNMENNFKLLDISFAKLNKLYKLTDLDDSKRLEIYSIRPIDICVTARKIGETENIELKLQQADYQNKWDQKEVTESEHTVKLKNKVRNLPLSMQIALKQMYTCYQQSKMLKRI